MGGNMQAFTAHIDCFDNIAVQILEEVTVALHGIPGLLFQVPEHD